MTDFPIFDLQGLYTELVERARSEGAVTKEAWDDLAEEIIDEHVRVGEMVDDDELQSIIEALKARFSDFKGEMS